MTTVLTTSTPKRYLVPAAWGFMLLASILPEIVLVEVLGRPDLLVTVRWVQLPALAALAAVSWLWQPLRPLWKYAAILFVILGAQMAMSAFRETAAWTRITELFEPGFARTHLSIQVWKTGVTIITLAGLLVLGYRRKDAFLVRGQLDAPITPVRWLGFPTPESWVSFGSKWIIFLSIGMVILLNIFGTVHFDALIGATGMLPVILILSALNAFNEEVVYRSAQLAPLEPAVGTRQALWIVAVLFGIAHFYSAVNGVAGAALTVFMGWMLTKAMLETRGFFWPWLIHFTQDVIIFWFIAGGSTRLN